MIYRETTTIADIVIGESPKRSNTSVLPSDISECLA